MSDSIAQEKLLELLKQHNGEITDLNILWTIFEIEEYDSMLYPALAELEFLGKIEVLRNPDDSFFSIRLVV